MTNRFYYVWTNIFLLKMTEELRDVLLKVKYFVMAQILWGRTIVLGLYLPVRRFFQKSQRLCSTDVFSSSLGMLSITGNCLVQPTSLETFEVVCMYISINTPSSIPYILYYSLWSMSIKVWVYLKPFLNFKAFLCHAATYLTKEAWILVEKRDYLL